MANPATSFASVFAANAARGLPPVAPRPPLADAERWQRDAEAEDRETAETLNNRKRRVARPPRPDRP
jgi:hypothetical protein